MVERFFGCAGDPSENVSSHQVMSSRTVPPPFCDVSGSRPMRWRQARCSSSIAFWFASRFVRAVVGVSCQTPCRSFQRA